jgi:hypothetical protein
MNDFRDNSDLSGCFDYLVITLLVIIILLGFFALTTPLLPDDFLTTLINKLHD